MPTDIFIYVLLGVNGFVISVASYLLKQVLQRFANLEIALQSLSEKLAVLDTKQEFTHEKFVDFGKFQERIDSELGSLRKRMHQVEGTLNANNIKCELNHKE